MNRNRIGWWIGVVAALAAAACSPSADPAAGSPAVPASAEFVLVERRPALAEGPLRRDEALFLRFSEAVDPASLRPGAVRVVGRDGRPFAAEVRAEGERLVVSAPPPFGYPARAEFSVLVEGFPSPMALRAKSGRPLSARARIPFTVSAEYRVDLVRPRVTSLDVETDASGLTVHARFSEPIDPATVVAGETFRVESLDGAVLPGRVIADRRSEWFRYLPATAAGLREIRVVLSPRITDLSGNPLDPAGAVRTAFRVTPGGDGFAGEIAEDFATGLMMDPAGTTALWNGARSPGVLVAEPSPTSILLEGDPAEPESFVDVGAREVLMRLILTPAELGPSRDLTGLYWTPAGAGFVPAEYQELFIRITPTTRETMDGPGFDLDAPRTVFERRPWRIEAGDWERAAVPFTEAFPWDGESNLLVEIRVGPGDHTNFLTCRRDPTGRSAVSRDGVSLPLRPKIALRSFSWAPVATSRFYDSGVEAPEWLPPILQPERLPDGVRMTLSFQGAKRLDETGAPPVGDLEATSPWTADPTELSGWRYLRFRIEFSGFGAGLEVAAIDDLVVPFRRVR